MEQCNSEIDKGDWNPLKQIILAVSDEVLGIEHNKRRNNWYDDECEEATREKNKAYREMLQKHCTRRLEEIYKEKRRQEKKIHKRKKKNYLDLQVWDLSLNRSNVSN
ncbi:hypothetical protein C0J52_11693 [Blattella germanica]|nr:hypothetical protein C0J52_11693 [Blattella germanica]